VVAVPEPTTLLGFGLLIATFATTAGRRGG